MSRLPQGSGTQDGSSLRAGRNRLLAGLEALAASPATARIRAAADAASIWTIQTGTGGLTTLGGITNEVQIGSESQANTLQGAAGNDLLVNGNAGGVLRGGADNDTLIGGSGADTLYGGDGIDYLSGGNDGDFLHGDAGNDELNGGIGDDRYYFSTDGGSDTVFDSDGVGAIVVNGVTVAIGQRLAENTWKSADGQLTVQRQRIVSPMNLFNLAIRDSTGQTLATIINWQPGQLGLALEGTYATAGQTAGDVIPFAGGGGSSQFSSHLLRPSIPGRRWSEEYDFGALREFRIGNRLLAEGDWPPAWNASGTGLARGYLNLDNLRGSDTGNDRIFGLDGNDSLDGFGGDDYLVGGDGSDLLNGGLGADTIEGGNDNDLIFGDRVASNVGSSVGTTSGQPYVPYGNGYSTVFSGLGWGYEAGPGGALLWGATAGYFGGSADIIDAGDGDDGVYAGDGNDVVSGGEGADFLVGEAGDDILAGGAGADFLLGDYQQSTDTGLFTYSTITASGRDDLHGGDDNDTLIGLGNDDRLYGDAGDDALYGDGDGNVLVNAAENGADMLDGGEGNDSLHGGGGSDTLLGGLGNDVLMGDSAITSGAVYGNDTLDGGAGEDQLIGDGGDDILFGGADNDQLFGDRDAPGLDAALQGHDHLDGGAGNDILVGGGSSDELIGGDGDDQLRGDQGGSGLPGEFQGDDALDGGAGADRLIGGGGADRLLGGDGADIIDGDDAVSRTPGENQGADYILAGAGDDTVFGWGGADTILGEDGNDQLVGDEISLAASFHGDDYLSGGAGNDSLWGLGGNDRLYGNEGDDLLQGDYEADPQLTGDDYLDGGTGNDVLWGGGGNDVLIGSIGNDYLDGGSGNDELNGGEGDDTLQGGAGDDTLHGGAGADLLYGGAGDDTYVFDEEDLRVVDSTADGIIDTEGHNRLVFRSGIALSEITLLEGSIAGTVLISQDDSALGLVIRDALSGSVSSFEFRDGTIMPVNRLIGGRYEGFADQNTSAAGVALFGGTRSDSISGYGTDAIISGGQGNDLLRGGSGSTTYLFERGDGSDVITDASTFAASGGLNQNTLSFGDGIAAGDVALALNAGGSHIALDLGQGDRIELTDFSANDVVGAVRTIDRLVFANGDAVTWDQLVSGRAVNITNTQGITAYDGTNLGDNIVGAAIGETINAGAGDDVLDGGGGDDQLSGGAGSDTYLFRRLSGSDTINNSDTGSGKVDRLQIADDIAIADLELFRVGASLFIRLLNSTDQVVVSNFFTDAGLDEIRFADGTVWTRAGLDAQLPEAHVDSFVGTAADDTFVVDSPLDSVSEAVNAGTDTIQAGVSYALPANVENLTLTGNFNLNATGNSLSNVLVGNVGNNILDGRGGQDTLLGGLGDDTYVLGSPDATSVVVVEAANEGTDWIILTQHLNYTLAANVENLRAQNIGSNFDPIRDLTGNALNNTIIGNSSPQHLDGGLGADVLIGGGGNDIYVVDNLGDVVIEDGDLGVQDLGDRVESYISYTLPANVEDLTLLGDAAINGTGNADGNLLNGILNPTANVLAGGAGNDHYIINDIDIVLENADEGSDSIEIAFGSATSYSIADYANVEILMARDTLGSVALVGDDHDNELIGNDADNLLVGGAGDDSLQGGGDSLFASDSDTLNGGTGNDFLSGGMSSDLYLFATGDGQDVISDSGFGFDTIQFTDGVITAADVLLARLGNSLEITLRNGSEQITVSNHFASSPSGNFSIEEILFADGTRWSESAIANRLANSSNIATEAGDTLTGTVADDVIVALGGDDNVSTGAGNDVIDGGDGNDTLFGNAGDDTLHGQDGDDSLEGQDGTDLIYGEAGADQIRAGAGGDVVYGGADSDWIDGEAGDDTLYGDDGDDTLMAGDGNDILDGGAGNDQLVGGFGSDTYRLVAGGGSDAISETQSALSSDVDILEVGTGITASEVAVTRADMDLILSVEGTSDLITIAGFFADQGNGVGDGEIEIVRFADGTEWTALDLKEKAGTITGTDDPETLNGSDYDDRIYGLGGDDILNGNGGNDVLDGGAGNDSLGGGSGNDTYLVDSGDTIAESSNQGVDVVRSSVNWTLGSNFENLVLLGSANVTGTGNNLANQIMGNTGNNTINGGSGADNLSGGAGDDTYVADNVGDVVVENADEGIDLIQSGVTYTLSANVENLTLTGSSGNAATGNELDNILTGNGGNNALSGGAGNDTLNGGSGSDAMSGGTGNDTYVVAQTTDTVSELSGEGTDLVQSSVTFTLSADVENLTLTTTSAINGTGNALDNLLTGNNGSNTLTGAAGNDTLMGGAGTDNMIGGQGDDTYFVDVSADITTESASEGIDLVNSSVTRSLASAGANIELLFLTGTSAINATGNALSNLLRGNSGVNTLVGSAGIDILEGGDGNDILSNTTNKTLLNGGAGADTMTGTAVNDLLIGGTGNDALTTGAGADIIAFNKGDGQDTVALSTTRDNTLSLGGGAVYADLLFLKNGNDLILSVGATDKVTFTGFYANAANHSVNNLQVVIEGTSDYDSGSADVTHNKKIETFDFEGLVAAFDAARIANPGLTSWALTNALLVHHLSGSDTAALGGDLAYRYNSSGGLSDISFTPTLGILGAGTFGTSAQALQSLGSLQDSSARLS
jgi:Ca2+-binding RTX toxin-like protein